MKAIRLHAPGGVDNLVVEEIATPTPAAGEALVRVHAAGITRDELDWPVDRLPAIPSYELSGTVVALGEGAVGVAPGQAVCALTDFDRDGVAAEYVAVPAERLAFKPSRLSHTESAALPLAALSAMQGLFDHGRLQAGQRVLVLGAAGGVGMFAVQLASLRGAYVIASTSAENVDAVRALGAHEVVDREAVDFSAVEPVHLVFDTAGGDRLARSVSLLEQGGRLVSVAEEPPRDLCAERGVEGMYFVVEPNQVQLGELTGLADQGLLRVLVGATYPLADARKAFERSLARGGRGKVVLMVVGGDGRAGEDAASASAMGHYTWVDNDRAVDWHELSELYRIAPLGDKPPESLATVFGNSMFKCFVYDGDHLVAVGRALADGLDCSYICDVAVHPEHQGRGLGKAVINELVARSRGHKKIILYANPGTEGFYAKLGFYRMNTAMAIWRDPERAIAAGLIRRLD